MSDQVTQHCEHPPHRSKYLVSESPIALYPSLAVAVGGSDRAIWLQQLNYWLSRSQHYHDGRYWVYNTLEEWQAQMPWLSLPTIRRIIGFFKAEGIVLTGNYNRSKTDRTTWYTIDDEALGRYLESAHQPDTCPSVKTTLPSGQIDHMATDQNEQMDVIKTSGSNQRVPENNNRDTSRMNLEVNPAREAATQKQDSTGHDLQDENHKDTGTHTKPVPKNIPRGIKSPDSEAVTSRKVDHQAGTEVKISEGGQEYHSEDIDSVSREWLQDSNTKPDLGKLSNERREELARVLFAARDFYREFADPHPEKSAIAMGNLFLRGEYEYERFYDMLLMTREELRRAQGQQNPGEFIRNKGAYFYVSVKNNLERVHSYNASLEPRERPESDFCSQDGGFIPPRQNRPLRGAQARDSAREMRRAS